MKQYLLPPASPAISKRLIAVVPARDEADVIGRAVGSLLAQRHEPAIEVIVVDDGSSDRTAEQATQAAVNCGRGRQLTVLRGSPLPQGWTGKLWALRQGTEHALRQQPDFLLFTDADIVHATDNVGNLLAQAESGNYDLASLMVKLACRTVAERALIPPFVFFFLQLYPPGWTRTRGRRTAGAAGGCLLIRPSALAAIGGLEAIRGQVIDDCALAQAVKRSGRRVWMGLTEEAVSIRGYDNAGAIRQMIARSAFHQLRHSPAILVATLAGLLVTYVVPPLAACFSRKRQTRWSGAAAMLLMAITYRPMAQFYKLRPWWYVALPAAALFYGEATIHSAIVYWRGQGGKWKGRTQDLR